MTARIQFQQTKGPRLAPMSRIKGPPMRKGGAGENVIEMEAGDQEGRNAGNLKTSGFREVIKRDGTTKYTKNTKNKDHGWH